MWNLATFRERLAKQISFAETYSPLYAAIWQAFMAWTADPDDEVTRWLSDAAASREPFDVTLLLVAALHQQALLPNSAEIPLCDYFPTVGGTFDPDQDEAGLREALRETVRLRGDDMAAFIQVRTIQTNETGRGIAWLLPLLMSGWSEVHLVDLGASAGLNLVGEQRAFRLTDGAQRADFGQGEPVQFLSEVDNLPQRWIDSAETPVPQILSRVGCDVHPFRMRSAEDEATLASYVWADQPVRMTRLREGIAAFKQTQESDVPVSLHAVHLPDELPDFLRQRVPLDPAPVLIYSTFIKAYLEDNGQALATHISTWARSQGRPVAWVQWEPPQAVGIAAKPPAFGWLTWTVDKWANGADLGRDQLGWTHPHGARMLAS